MFKSCKIPRHIYTGPSCQDDMYFPTGTSTQGVALDPEILAGFRTVEAVVSVADFGLRELTEGHHKLWSPHITQSINQVDPACLYLLVSRVKPCKYKFLSLQPPLGYISTISLMGALVLKVCDLPGTADSSLMVLNLCN